MSFDALVLSGGGLKGLSHLGVLKYYEEEGLYNYEEVKVFSGTSVGSAICALLACGVEVTSLFSKIYEKSDFLIKPPAVNVFELLKDMGVMSISPFIEYLDKLIKEELGFTPTFKELFSLTGKKLVIAVTNVTVGKVEYFSPDYEGDCNILKAVEMSCSLPLIFPKVYYKNSLYWDGGISDNIPILKTLHCEKILVSTVVDNNKFKDGDFFSYLYKIATLPSSILTRYKYNICSSNERVVSVSTNLQGISLVGLSIPSTVKMSCYLKGYHSAHLVNSKKELVVEGWDWNSDPSDGWDIDF